MLIKECLVRKICFQRESFIAEPQVKGRLKQRRDRAVFVNRQADGSQSCVALPDHRSALLPLRIGDCCEVLQHARQQCRGNSVILPSDGLLCERHHLVPSVGVRIECSSHSLPGQLTVHRLALFRCLCLKQDQLSLRRRPVKVHVSDDPGDFQNILGSVFFFLINPVISVAASIVVQHVVQRPGIQSTCPEHAIELSLPRLPQGLFESVEIAKSKLSIGEPARIAAVEIGVRGEKRLSKLNLLLRVFDFLEQPPGALGTIGNGQAWLCGLGPERNRFRLHLQSHE